ncbi:beta-hexosaminidase [Holotrichia oblita]|uniref:Beta-hexosaminidase n=2 Tax=Holotrichia oblita TaxID=644536 RepID=A0ACB9TJH4_HOLOL|nr:beta-hexosaminidase [Holotrichia oblita]
MPQDQWPITSNRIKIMKASDLRRALLLLLLLCGVLMVYFFSQQTSRLTIPHLSGIESSIDSAALKTDVRWSWLCTKNHCEKIPLATGTPMQSLSTCNMLCGDSPQIWPIPSGPSKIGTEALAFRVNQLQLETTVKESALAYLEQSFAAFNDNVVSYMKKRDSALTQIRSDIDSFLVKISVVQANIIRLRMNTDESYNLTVNLYGKNLLASINAYTVFGARHGLETLSQLIWWDELDTSGTLRIVTNAIVHDKPLLPYRGIMLDTSRNFISIPAIKKVINGMAANKLNVFHWHVSDSQSFPLEIPSVPQMHLYGAYQTDMVYTAQEVAELVEYSRLKGVRIVIEIDIPAHAGNGWTWGPQEGLGELAVCVNAQPWFMYCGEPPCGQLNPENQQVYEVLERIYRDIIKMTGEDELFHIGGDEVNLDCWEQHLLKNLTSTNYTDLHNLWGEFTLKILHKLERANGGRKPPYTIAWSSNLNMGASDWSETRELISDGYKVILSHVNAWYLDCGFGRWRERGEAACDPYRPWQTVYLHQPWAYDPLYKSHTVGAEACLWSEQLDELSLDARLWPRAAAFAERVWSDPKINPDTYGIAEDVYTRLSVHRDRMMSRDLGVEALWPRWCTQNPGMCL